METLDCQKKKKRWCNEDTLEQILQEWEPAIQVLQGQFESCVLQIVEFSEGTQEMAAEFFQEWKNCTHTTWNYLFFFLVGEEEEEI